MRGNYHKGEIIMNKENKKLLAEVINDRLTKSLGENPEESSAAFEEAMQAIDRQNEMDKDRKEKGCEYAVLVTMLEADNELYICGGALS